MNKHVAAILAIAIASPTLAGGYATPVVAPVATPVAAAKPAFSWTGAYVGVTAGKTSADIRGTWDEYAGTEKRWSDDGKNWSIEDIFETVSVAIDDTATTYGAFAGYRRQLASSIVLGGEASYTRTGTLFADYDGERIEAWGVEGQLGYAISRALPYVAAGYAQVEGEDALSLSLGLDYALTDRIVVGAKYSRLDIGQIDGIDAVRGFEADTDLVSIRAALRF